MSDMRIYKERKLAANTINDAIKNILARGESVKINSLIQEITLQYAVPEQWVEKRIYLFKESNNKVIIENGELWLQSDLTK